jgi:AcrR family transcriptional regulator
MKDLKSSRKTRYTRMVLRDSLMELIKEKPVTKVTVTELCHKADINRATFYAHFKDQYELLQEIENETIAYFEEMLKKYDNRRSRRETTQMVEEMLQYIADNSNSIQVLLSENGDIGFQKKLFHRFTRQEQVMKYLTDTTDAGKREYFSVFMVYGMIGLIQYWLKNSMTIPVADLARLFIKLSPTSFAR